MVAICAALWIASTAPSMASETAHGGAANGDASPRSALTHRVDILPVVAPSTQHSNELRQDSGPPVGDLRSQIFSNASAIVELSSPTPATPSPIGVGATPEVSAPAEPPAPEPMSLTDPRMLAGAAIGTVGGIGIVILQRRRNSDGP